MEAQPSPIVVITPKFSIYQRVGMARGNRGRTMALHDAEELDDDLRARADEHLTLATALGVDDVVLSRALRTGWTFGGWMVAYQAVILEGGASDTGNVARQSTHEDRYSDHD